MLLLGALDQLLGDGLEENLVLMVSVRFWIPQVLVDAFHGKG